MLEYERTLARFQIGFTHKLADGIDEARMTHQPAPGMNPPLWILGHVAMSLGGMLQRLGKPGLVPAEWRKLFGPGTDPAKVPEPHPSKAMLVSVLTEAAGALIAATEAATVEELAVPNPVEFVRGVMPTLGDLIAHIMTTHWAFHLGQLSAWRRLHGLPPVLGF